MQYLGDTAIEVVGDWLSNHRKDRKDRGGAHCSNKKERDARMSFKYHLTNAGLKALKVARALADIMSNIGGLKQPRRLLLSSVVHSGILCGAPIWADTLCRNPSYAATCQRACRIIALRVACAYRTVSEIALVVVGLPSVDLMAAE